MNTASICIVCLAPNLDTELLPMGEFEKLYEVLAGKCKFKSQKLHLCLTCHSFFAEIQKFQAKIQSAQFVLTIDEDFEDDNGYPETECEPVKQELEIKDDIIKFENVLKDSFESPKVQEPVINTSEFQSLEVQETVINKSDSFQCRDNQKPVITTTTNVAKCKKKTTEKRNKNNDLHEPPNIPEGSIKTIQKVSINISKNPKKKQTNQQRSDKDIDELIKKLKVPYDRKYVKELLSYRNKEPKILDAEEFYRNKRDLVVDTQLCVDDAEVKELMKKSRSQQRYRKKYTIKCDKCVLVFKGKKILKQHSEETHSKSLGPYECHFCGTRSSNEQTIEAHSRSHYTKYVCLLCGHVDCNESQMGEHFRHKKKIFQCTLCGKIFGERSDFKEHHYSTHMQYTCDYCNKSYTDRLWFEVHILKIHSPLHRCDQCGKVYGSYTRLHAHIQYVHLKEDKEENYCVECDRQLPNRIRYNRHVQSHIRKRLKRDRYPCPECDASYHCSYYLRRHIDHVHKNRSAQCDICSKRFVRKALLQVHILSVHEKVRRPKHKICQYCGRAFADQRILTHHIRTHTGERPHTCPLCDAAFAQKAALHSHIRARHKDAPPDLTVWKTTRKKETLINTDL